jgi:8-oxo-dGTP diphosphatase
MRFQGQIIRRMKAGGKAITDVLYKGETEAPTQDKAISNLWYQAALAKSPKVRTIHAKDQKSKRDLKMLSDLVGKFIQDQQYWDYKCEVMAVDKKGQGQLSFESKLALVLEYEDSPFTACIAVFRRRNNDLQVLAIQRKGEPAMGEWALPGGHANQEEIPEVAARRELAEETGIHLPKLMLHRTREASPASPKKDYIFTQILDDNRAIMPSDDAQGIRWISINELPSMAFGDDDIARECANLFAI